MIAIPQCLDFADARLTKDICEFYLRMLEIKNSLQDEMRMSEAMNNYLTAYYKYKVANLSLLKLTGQLDQVK